MSNLNPLFLKDAYKTGHLYQYPPKTEFIYSNMTARGAQHFAYKGFNGKVVNFGARGFVKEILQELWNLNFFEQPVDEVVGEYQKMINSALGAEVVDTRHLRELHELGYLPLQVKALPEGELVNLRIPLMTIMNTDPRFSWLVNFMETVWANYTWKPLTVATIAYEYRRLSEKWADKTGADKGFAIFQNHDFSARGMSGAEDSMRAGAGHLLSSVGSDTLAAGKYLVDYYDASWDNLIFTAPPATEHAVMCINYALYGELETYRRLINEVYPSGMVAIVSDTINLWDVLTKVAPELYDDIMKREGNAFGPGKVVFRPDSGDPVKIIVGDEGLRQWPIVDGAALYFNDAASYEVALLGAVFRQKYSISEKTIHYKHLFNDPQKVKFKVRLPNGNLVYGIATYPEGLYSDEVVTDPNVFERHPTDGTIEHYEPTNEEKGALQILWDEFGGTTNEAGFRVLDPHVGLVYGDSITLERAEEIYTRMAENGFASTNIVFGVGSFTYQYLTRDTFGLAVKATWGQVDGKGYDLQKTPATDSGTKYSAKGLLRVEKENGEYVLHQQQTMGEANEGELQTIFGDGELYNQQSLSEIRERLWPTV
jgi:nicotinamide phosphoribosyltransferase